MTSRFRVVLAAAIAVVLLSRASRVSAQPFEGIISMRVSGMGAGRGADAGGGAPQSIEYLVRAGKVRLNIAGAMGSMGLLGVPAEKKMYVLLDQQSMYMEIGTDMAGRGMGGDMASMPEPKLTRTGKKETIAGYECEHVTVAAAQETTDVCLATGLGPFVDAMSAMGGMMGRGGRGGGGAASGWQRALGADGAFPLKVTRPDGAVQLEVTRIERKVLPAAQFEVPGNYSKMDMPRRP